MTNLKNLLNLEPKVPTDSVNKVKKPLKVANYNTFNGVYYLILNSFDNWKLSHEKNGQKSNISL